MYKNSDDREGYTDSVRERNWEQGEADLSIDCSLLSRGKINLLASQLTTHLTASNQNFIKSFLSHWKFILKICYTWNKSEWNRTAKKTGTVIISVIPIQGKSKISLSSFILPFLLRITTPVTVCNTSESNCFLFELFQMKGINTMEIIFE